MTNLVSRHWKKVALPAAVLCIDQVMGLGLASYAIDNPLIGVPGLAAATYALNKSVQGFKALPGLAMAVPSATVGAFKAAGTGAIRGIDNFGDRKNSKMWTRPSTEKEMAGYDQALQNAVANGEDAKDASERLEAAGMKPGRHFSTKRLAQTALLATALWPAALPAAGIMSALKIIRHMSSSLTSSEDTPKNNNTATGSGPTIQPGVV